MHAWLIYKVGQSCSCFCVYIEFYSMYVLIYAQCMFWFMFNVYIDLCLMYVFISVWCRSWLVLSCRVYLSCLVVCICALINALINTSFYVVINALICGCGITVGTCVHVYKHYSADCCVYRPDGCAGFDVSSNTSAYI